MNLSYTTIDKLRAAIKNSLKGDEVMLKKVLNPLRSWRGNIVIVDDSDKNKTVFIEGAGTKRKTISLIYTKENM